MRSPLGEAALVAFIVVMLMLALIVFADQHKVH